MRIAVVGSGISGIVASYLLDRRHEVTLYEKRNRLGGHSHTVDVTLNGQTHPVDTGFIVYNERNYPNFETFLERLDVITKPTSMSFSFRDDQTDLEYGGGGLSEFFAQRRNLLSPSHWQMLFGIVRFYFLAPFRKSSAADETLGDFLDGNNFNQAFIEDHLIPMVSAIWSVPLKTARQFPFRYVIDFFENHGLLNLWNRPQWRTIEGGAREYLSSFEERFDGVIRTGKPVDRIDREDDEVHVQSESERARFDAAVLAAHSDQSLSMLAEPTDEEKGVLGSIEYESNDVVLHTDRSVLPDDKAIWSSWNYHRDTSSESTTTVTYNLSILQDLPFEEPVCVTLNPGDRLRSDAVLERFNYSHPVYDTDAIRAQNRKTEVSGTGNVFYAGAYWGDGFHEDGVESALHVASQLGVEDSL